MENLCDAFCVLDDSGHNPFALSPLKAPSPSAPCNIQRYKAATVSPSAEHHRALAVSTRSAPSVTLPLHTPRAHLISLAYHGQLLYLTWGKVGLSLQVLEGLMVGVDQGLLLAQQVWSPMLECVNDGQRLALVRGVARLCRVELSVLKCDGAELSFDFLLQYCSQRVARSMIVGSMAARRALRLLPGRCGGPLRAPVADGQGARF